MKGTFAGANIKGTPSMKAWRVRKDLKTIRRKADVIGLQEFKWRWYWRVVGLLLVNWSSWPGKTKGLAHPVLGAQAVLWKRKLFKRVRVYTREAFDFAMDNGGIMDNRWIRAALLRAREDGFTAWFLSTHFAVGADKSGSSERRKAFLRSNLRELDKALADLRRTGYPIMGELDANIHRGTWAYRELMNILLHHGATVHGEHGVEYAFTIPGRKGEFTEVNASRIGTSQLETDHEVRLLRWVGHASKP